MDEEEKEPGNGRDDAETEMQKNGVCRPPSRMPEAVHQAPLGTIRTDLREDSDICRS